MVKIIKAHQNGWIKKALPEKHGCKLHIRLHEAKLRHPMDENDNMHFQDSKITNKVIY